jgi:hypothetical protein
MNGELLIGQRFKRRYPANEPHAPAHEWCWLRLAPTRTAARL